MVEKIDITCGKNKVIVCQVPLGNPGNAHPICISVNAVPTHLAKGDYLDNCKSAARTTQQSVELSAGISAYPNPFSDMINIEYITIQDGNLRVDIYDVTGKLLSTLFNEFAEAGITYSSGFYAENIPNGVYFVRMTTLAGVYNQKIVLTR
jgi:hypothetical protein